MDRAEQGAPRLTSGRLAPYIGGYDREVRERSFANSK